MQPLRDAGKTAAKQLSTAGQSLQENAPEPGEYSLVPMESTAFIINALSMGLGGTIIETVCCFQGIRGKAARCELP